MVAQLDTREKEEELEPKPLRDVVELRDVVLVEDRPENGTEEERVVEVPVRENIGHHRPLLVVLALLSLLRLERLA